MTQRQADRCVAAYARALHKGRAAVIAAWLLLACGLAYFGTLFLGATTQKFSPPPGTQSAAAQAVLGRVFPDTADRAAMTAFVTCPPVDLRRCGLDSVTDVPAVRDFFADLRGQLRLHPAGRVKRYDTFYSFSDLHVKALARHFVSAPTTAGGGGGRPVRAATLGIATLDVPFSAKPAMEFAPTFLAAVATAKARLEAAVNASVCGGGLAPRLMAGAESVPGVADPAGIAVGATGIPIMASVAIKHIKVDLGNADAVVMPIAMVIFGVTVGSVRLLVFPLACIALTLGLSFALCYFVTFTMPMYASVPSLMMSLVIAMSIDYNLFLLTRFVEEVQAGNRGIAAVVATVRSAGGTILISGVTLIVPFGTLCAFPLDMLRSFGIGCTIAIVVAMAISLTLTPAMLLAFGRFFEGAAAEAGCWACVPASVRRAADAAGRRYRAVATPETTGCGARACAAVRTFFTDLCGQGTDLPSANRPTVGEAAAADGYMTAYLRKWSARLQTTSGQLQTDNAALACVSSRDGDGDVGAPLLAADSSPPFHPSGGLDTSATPPASWPSQSIGPRASVGGGVSLEAVVYSMPQRAGPRPSLVKRMFTVASRVVRFPWNAAAVVIISALVGVCAWQASDLQRTDSFVDYFVRGGEAGANYRRAADLFGWGFVEPYTVLFEASTAGSSMLSRPQWEAAQLKLRAIVSDPALPFTADDVTSPMMFSGQYVSYETAAACIASMEACQVTHLADTSLPALLEGQTAKNFTFLSALLASPIPPTGRRGGRAYRRLMEILKAPVGDDAAPSSAAGKAVALSSSNGGAIPAGQPDVAGAGFRVWLDGIGPSSLDAVGSVYDRLPLIAAATAVGVVVIVGLAFRSLLVAFRCLITVVMTEAFAFAVALWVYQDGVGAWTGWGSLAERGALSWITPIISSVVIVGVALDYDIFLLSRVSENLRGGMQSSEAVAAGLVASGPVITAAGAIMAVAFFGLMIAKVTLVNEVGLILVSAVLFDTFVVRTFLAPAVMGLLGRWHWWPMRVDAGVSHSANDGTYEDIQATVE